MQQANAIMASPQAQQFVESINTAAGSALNMIDKGITIGINLGIGVAKGIETGGPGVINAVTKVGTDAIGTLTDLWGMKSPSRVFAEMGAFAAEGLELGLVDRTSKGFDRWAEALEKAGGDAFIRGVEGIAKRLGVKPEWLLNVMAFESDFNPKAANPKSSARGLIQFMNPTAQGMGFKSSSQITRLSAMQQLRLVEQYYKPFAGKMRNQGDVYSAVAAGKLGGPSGVLFTKGSREYRDNKIWDANRDGVITSEEIGRLASRKGGFTSKATPKGSADVTMGAVADVMNMTAQMSTLSLTANGKPITTTDPMPVVIQNVTNLTQNATKIALGEGDPIKNAQAVVEATTKIAESLPPVSSAAMITVQTMPPLVAGMSDLSDAATDMTETATESAEAWRAAMIMVGDTGTDMIGRLAGAIGQVAGMMPQQTVGKKRGLFSKILGVAAPFLSFIPGVGPILSMAAGMASNALGGNWGGVVSGLATGLQPGGVFRSSGSGSGSPGGASSSTGAPLGPGPATGDRGAGLTPRAMGGPVRRGRRYIVGEHRPELFVPNTDGYIHPRVGARSEGVDAMTAQLVAALDRHNAALERQNSILGRLEGVRPHDVVRMGARGMLDAMDNDAGLIRLHGQRLRLP